MDIDQDIDQHEHLSGNPDVARKRILIVATGGTIASTEGRGGLAPMLSGEQLAGYVPEIRRLCDFDAVQPMNIDSTNMRPHNWLRIRDEIVSRYDDYDGFVVLHGTDTMAYTAAALSYLVQGSPKPIVLTGSQRPMANPFTDAKLNLYQSVLYATDPLSHDVSVVFGGEVIAGTRARKQRTMSFNAFTSVNFPTLALIRGERVVRAGVDRSAAAGLVGATGHGGGTTGRGGMRTYDRLNERVFVLKLTPEVGPGIFRLLKADYDAVIVETFGLGGIPERTEDGSGEEQGLSFEEAIADWVASGRTVVLTTQVPEEGCDLGVYEVGRAYANNPAVLKGADMTTEALVAKTMWALGQSDDPKEIRELFYRPVNHDRID